MNGPEGFWTWGSGQGEGPMLHQALFLQCATERKAPAKLSSQLRPSWNLLFLLQPCSASFLPSVISKKQTQMLVGEWLVWPQLLSEELDLNQLLTSVLLLFGALSFPVRGAGEGCVVGAGACRLASTHRCQECFPLSCDNCECPQIPSSIP